MIKQIINTFVVIAACLGLAAFILVLVKKQNCQTKEPFDNSSLHVMKRKVGTSDGQTCTANGDCNPTVNPGQLASKWQTGASHDVRQSQPYAV